MELSEPTAGSPLMGGGLVVVQAPAGAPKGLSTGVQHVGYTADVYVVV